jgi:type IV pilus assembly protein PilA
MARKQPGFSVVELVVVVAIIVVIAAIAWPYLFGARQKADQASAVASISAINVAEATYQSTYPAQGYSPSLSSLGSNGSTCETPSPTNACLLDPAVATGIKDGYVFDLVGDGNTPDLSYTITATPESTASGGCIYSSNQSGNIQVGPATPPQGLSASVPSGSASSCN